MVHVSVTRVTPLVNNSFCGRKSNGEKNVTKKYTCEHVHIMTVSNKKCIFLFTCPISKQAVQRYIFARGNMVTIVILCIVLCLVLTESYGM